MKIIQNTLNLIYFAEVYSQPCQTSKMERSTIFFLAKRFILYVLQGIEYFSV